MAKIQIDVRNVSKRYRLGLKEERSDSLMGSLGDILKTPFKSFNKLRSLSKFEETEDESILWAIKDLTFQVREGDVLGVIGKNGAGKSTLLKLLSRITRPTEGTIDINGRVASLLEVGTGFHKELSGRENIYMNGTILGMTKKEIDKKFDEIVDFSGVERFIDTPVKRYSSGMQVRLAFSVAASLEPEILVIDEVLAVGDAEFQKRCLGKMQGISDSGRTILFVSHNMAAMQSLCNRCIYLESGRMIAEGETSKMIDLYLTRNHSTDTEREWNDMRSAPGNEFVRLKRAVVYAPECPDKSILFINQELVMEFDFWNLQAMSTHITMKLNSIKGEVIFNAASVAKHLEEGVYRCKYHIPANLLNDNHYIIDLFFVKDSSRIVCSLEDVVGFEVQEPPREGNWYGKWEGVVRPSLRTEIELL